VVRESVVPASSTESLIVAFVWPAMRLIATAPPPAKPVLPCRLTATVIADAVEVAKIVPLPLAATTTAPLAEPSAIEASVASVALRMSLRATLSPTPTLADSSSETATATTGALTVARIAALSVAVTVRSPPWASTTDAPVSVALVSVLTLFIAMTGAMETAYVVPEPVSPPPLPPSAGGAGGAWIAMVSADETIRAAMAASVEAVTDTAPEAVTGVPVTAATAAAGFSSPMSCPAMASANWNAMFWESQPMALNARTTPTAAFADEVSAVMIATMSETFCASTTTSPAAASSAPSVTVARAPEVTLFVAMMPLNAWPSRALAMMLEVSVDRIVAVSIAVTDTPPPARTSIRRTSLVTPPRTSFRTAMPPPAVALLAPRM